MTAKWWEIQSDYTAYIYGFAFADGLVRRTDHGTVRNELILTQSDRTVLDAIMQVAPGGRLVYSEGAKVWRLTFGASTGVRADYLAEWGLVPNKTENGYWPRILHPLFVPDYIRGFFDGDGHVSMVKRKSDNGMVTRVMFICHLRQYLEHLELELRRRGASERPIHQDGHNFRLRYHSQTDIPFIYDLLYSGATLYDKRKRARFLKVVTYRSVDHRPGGADHPNAVFTNDQVAEMRRLYESGEATLPQLAKRTGRSTSAVWGVLTYQTYKDVTS